MQYILGLIRTIKEKRRSLRRNTQELDKVQHPIIENARPPLWPISLPQPMYLLDLPDETVIEGSYHGYLGEESYEASSIRTPSQFRESMLGPIEIVDRDSIFSSKRSSAWAQRARYSRQQPQQMKLAMSHDNLAKLTKAHARLALAGQKITQDDSIIAWATGVESANFRARFLWATREPDMQPYVKQARNSEANWSSSAGQDTCSRTADRPPTPIPPRILTTEGVIQPYRSLRKSKSLPSMSFHRVSRACFNPDVAVPALPKVIIGMAV